MSNDFDFGGAVPSWGRSAAEYEAFFALSDVPSSARIFDCGGGPSSFAAEWSKNGQYVVAVDPIYRFLPGIFQPTSIPQRHGCSRECRRHETGSSGIITAARKMSSNDGVMYSLPLIPISKQRLGEVAMYLPAYRNYLSCRNPSILYFVLIYYFSTQPNLTQKSTYPSCGKCFALVERCEYFLCLTWMVNFPRIWTRPFRHCECQHALSLFHCLSSFGLVIRICYV